MLRYMNFEIGVMELTNPEWFTEDGQLREQDIERWVEMNTGLGPTLSHAYRVMGPPSASPLTPEEKHEWDQISRYASLFYKIPYAWYTMSVLY